MSEDKLLNLKIVDMLEEEVKKVSAERRQLKDHIVEEHGQGVWALLYTTPEERTVENLGKFYDDSAIKDINEYIDTDKKFHQLIVDLQVYRQFLTEEAPDYILVSRGLDGTF